MTSTMIDSPLHPVHFFLQWSFDWCKANRLSSLSQCDGTVVHLLQSVLKQAPMDQLIWCELPVSAGMKGECLSVGYKSFLHQQTQWALNIHFKNPIPLVTCTPALTHGRSSRHNRITHLSAGSGSLSEFLSRKLETVKVAAFLLFSLIQLVFLGKSSCHPTLVIHMYQNVCYPLTQRRWWPVLSGSSLG